jgi:hypothetical protein
MHGRPSRLSETLLSIVLIAVIVLMAVGARSLLPDRPVPGARATPQSGPLPRALADEMKRNEQAAYLLGISDAVEFWRLTGVAPDTPGLRAALWARRQLSPDPLTPPEAQVLLQRLHPDTEP